MSPTKFRKKPVTVDAWQFTGSNAADIQDWIESFGHEARTIGGDEVTEPALVIRTLEGDIRADVGDWVIQGVKNEFYPCKPDVFARTYDPVAGV